MKRFVIKERGVVVQGGLSAVLPPGAQAVEGDPMRLIGLVELNGEFVPPPPRPSRHHVWTGWGWSDPRPPAMRQDDAQRERELLWAQVRNQRAARLAATDWVVLRAQERGEPVPDDWRDYRQALRDITEQTDPYQVVWPIRPD